jgi:rhodanese-related sulfurtransferase
LGQKCWYLNKYGQRPSGPVGHQIRDFIGLELIFPAGRTSNKKTEAKVEIVLIGAAVVCILVIWWLVRQVLAKREIEAKSIEPEELYALLDANQVLLYDVRQPLDFLAHAEIIPGATRIAPKDIAEQTSSFSRDQHSVIYCTGGDHQTCRMVLGKARALNFTRVKILKGGLAAWKEKGYPVEAYTESFHLDTAS